MDLKRTLAAAASLLLAGCEIYAEPAPIPCPGTRQGVFQFAGAVNVPVPVECAWAANQYQSTLDFPGSISYGEAPSMAAWLCIDAPHAVPREGDHTPDDHITVAYKTPVGVGNCTCPSEAASFAGGCSCPPTSPLANCNCPVRLTETVTGTMQKLIGGSIFSGFQTVTVEPPEALVGATSVCDCQKECSFDYVLKGNPL